MLVRLAKDQQDINKCLELRREVFVGEQNVPEALELDGKDDQCTHFIAIDGDMTIGAARILPMGEYHKIQRVCVAASKRGTGVGAAIMEVILQHSKAEEEINSLKLSSQKNAIPFYEKLGFTAYGDEYLDAGISHRDMELSLK